MVEDFVELLRGQARDILATRLSGFHERRVDILAVLRGTGHRIGWRRRVLVQLTRAGKKEARRLATLTETSIEALLNQIPKSKHKTILESLGLLRGALERVRKDGTCC